MRRFRGIASAVFVCAAGCGKDHPLVDAPLADSGTTDANTTSDAATDVVVTTYSRAGVHASGTLEANIPVVTIQPNGQVGPTGTTGTDGTVTLQGVEAGASISAIYPVTGGTVMATMLGVKPGDRLTFGERFEDQHAAADNGTLTVDFPAVTGAVSYSAYWGCPGSASIAGPATSIAINESCDAPTINVLLLAYDDAGTIIATGLLKDVPFAGTVSATLAAWTTATTNDFAASITGLDPAVDAVDLGADLVADHAYEYVYWNFATPAQNAASSTLKVGPGGDRVYAYAVLHQNAASTPVGRQEAYQALAPGANAAPFTAPALPWLTSQTTVDLAAQKVSWTPVGTGAYDAAVIRADWSRTNAQQVTTTFSWIVAVPPGGTSLSWASAPGELAPYVPTQADAVSASVMLVDLSTVTDFDHLRAAPEWQWAAPGRATARGELTGISTASFDGAEGNPPPIARHPAR